jgi:acyl-CoA thioester hydrolase
MKGSLFSLEMKVRDYECDMQGRVNNAVYQNYLEHARHEFLLSRQISFADLARRGINLVVTRAELDYKLPLTSGEGFIVNLNLERISPLRFAFSQEIRRASDGKLVLVAKIIATGVNERGRPELPPEVTALLAT